MVYMFREPLHCCCLFVIVIFIIIFLSAKILLHQQKKPKCDDDAVTIDCLNCGKMILLKEWHAHNSKCEGGCSGEPANSSNQVHIVDEEDANLTANHYDGGSNFSFTTRNDSATQADPMSSLVHKGENVMNNHHLSWYHLFVNLSLTSVFFFKWLVQYCFLSGWCNIF